MKIGEEWNNGIIYQYTEKAIREIVTIDGETTGNFFNSSNTTYGNPQSIQTEA